LADTSGSPTTATVPRKKGLFYGWWIVISGIFLHFFSGGSFYYGFSVFFNPIRDTFQWNAADTTVAFTLRGLETGMFSPLVGVLADKIAPRKLMLAGWTVIGLGFILLSRINSLWAFYATFMLIALGMSFGTGLVMNTTIANWFSRKRSRALSLILLGPGFSGLLAPLMAISVGQIGWRQTLLVLGLTLWIIGIPLCLVFRDRPGNYGYLPDGDTAAASAGAAAKANNQDKPSYTAKEALKTRAFWLLSMSSLFQQMGTSAITVHIVAYLESINVPTAIAAIAVTGMTICSLIGRLGIGFLGDFTNKRYLIAASLALQTVGLFLFSLITANSLWLLAAFLLTYGPGFGGPIPLRPALQADYFGTKSYGSIMGLLTLTSVAGGLLSPVIAGRIFDVTGSYRLAWQIFTIVTIPSIPLILLAIPPRHPRTTQA
jgi:sugar phosphate permease